MNFKLFNKGSSKKYNKLKDDNIDHHNIDNYGNKLDCLVADVIQTSKGYERISTSSMKMTIEESATQQRRRRRKFGMCEKDKNEREEIHATLKMMLVTEYMMRYSVL